jgi:NAD(P)-dependent dehydrogenase (short-subunit alcohol dehydrogenase family)
MKGENIALVTGSSSGIGFETALLLARSGFHTYASMRNLQNNDMKTGSERTARSLTSRLGLKI